MCYLRPSYSTFYLFQKVSDMLTTYLLLTTLLKKSILFQKVWYISGKGPNFTAHQFGQKWSLPQQLLYNVSSSGPPSSPLLSIFCLGRRTLSTSFKSLLRYRQILQWSPWSSRAPNTQFRLIQTVTYWLDNVYGINNEGTMEKWRLALTKKEVLKKCIDRR